MTDLYLENPLDYLESPLDYLEALFDYPLIILVKTARFAIFEKN